MLRESFQAKHGIGNLLSPRHPLFPQNIIARRSLSSSHGWRGSSCPILIPSKHHSTDTIKCSCYGNACWKKLYFFSSSRKKTVFYGLHPIVALISIKPHRQPCDILDKTETKAATDAGDPMQACSRILIAIFNKACMLLRLPISALPFIVHLWDESMRYTLCVLIIVSSLVRAPVQVALSCQFIRIPRAWLNWHKQEAPEGLICLLII